MMATCGRDYVSWRSSAGGSAIDGCTSCLRRDGITINRKKTQRLYREEGLTVQAQEGTQARRGRAGTGTGVGSSQPALEPGLRP